MKLNYRKVWFVILPILLFTLLILCIEAGLTVGFEDWAYAAIVEGMSPSLTSLMKGFSYLGNTTVVTTLCIVLLLVSRTRKTLAMPVSIAVILSTILNIALKNIISRERPDILQLITETGYSFPSGHAMINATLYTMLILQILKYSKPGLRRNMACVICIGLTLAISSSRIYLGVHYVDDILGGWLIGFAISLFVYYLWEALLTRKDRV